MISPRRALSLATLTIALTWGSGCSTDDLAGAFVDGEFGEEFREVIHQLAYTRWSDVDGALRLDFQYRYGLGLEDPDGVAPVDWSYGLVNRDGYAVIPFAQEQMREPQPGKDNIFVTGRRTRALTLDGAPLQAGEDYVLFFRLCYRGEILGEYLFPVTVGEDFTVDASELPDLPPERIGDPLSCDLPLPPLVARAAPAIE